MTKCVYDAFYCKIVFCLTIQNNQLSELTLVLISADNRRSTVIVKCNMQQGTLKICGNIIEMLKSMVRHNHNVWCISNCSRNQLLIKKTKKSIFMS